MSTKYKNKQNWNIKLKATAVVRFQLTILSSLAIDAVQSKIAEFNDYTVQYGIDSTTFEIKWYNDLIYKLK